jgi:hypothetical protein
MMVTVMCVYGLIRKRDLLFAAWALMALQFQATKNIPNPRKAHRRSLNSYMRDTKRHLKRKKERKRLFILLKESNRHHKRLYFSDFVSLRIEKLAGNNLDTRRSRTKEKLDFIAQLKCILRGSQKKSAVNRVAEGEVNTSWNESNVPDD